MKTADFIVIGGGIIGINIAKGLKKIYPRSDVVLLEKESRCGQHASGRNSGVLHAGFYYTKDSLKARFTKEGNRSLTEYCEENKLPINKCGKLVVTRGEGELDRLDELLQRGLINGIELKKITAEEAKYIEPRVVTYEHALYSPSTSTVNPGLVVGRMEQDAKNEGVEFHYGCRYIAYKNKKLITTSGNYASGHLVNAAGLYADMIARDFGFSQNYRILPFKGLYLYSNEPAGSLNTNVYPVPDLRNPFLGVHFTLTVNREVKIGPTAIPAFWRENYNGLNNFNFLELMEIVPRQVALLCSSSFLRLSIEEMKKNSRRHMVALANHMIKHTNAQHFTKWGNPGVRAQLVDIQSRKLEMDFVIEGGTESTHILNAVSPGFTCAIPFSDFVCHSIMDKLS